MKKISVISITIALLLAAGCSHKSGNAKAEQELIFPKGEKITNDNFIGTAFLNSLVVADSTNPNSVGSVTFEPGARTNWHSHPAGQIILVIAGEATTRKKEVRKKYFIKAMW